MQNSEDEDTLIQVLKRALLGNDKQELCDALDAMNGMCSILDSNREFYLGAGLLPVLTQALRVAMDTDDQNSAASAVACIEQFAQDPEAVSHFNADPNFIPLFGDYILFKTREVPGSPEEVEAWLKEVKLGHLYPDFVREGIVTRERMESLAKKSAGEIAVLLNLKGGDALHLELAFENAEE
jgi:hypothetical protein